MRRASTTTIILTTVLITAFATLSGCASGGGVVKREAMVEFSDEDREAVARSTAAPYTLQPGDVFNVESLTGEELDQANVLVLPDGTASFAGLGNRPVSGRSLADVEAELVRDYGRMFRDVDINVIVTKIEGMKIFVLGEVTRPGLYPVTSARAGILGLVAEAGGFGDWAQQGSIVLLRLTDSGYVSREIDLRAIREGTAFDPEAFDLQAYDILWVSRSAIGDFASFTTNVVGSLTEYTRMILDVRQIENPTLLRR